MKYKMLVLDMDDTLLTDDHKISTRNKEMLMKAQDMGVYVVLASGRPTPAMESFAKELELKRYGSYMLSYNGAVITDMKHEQIIFEQSLSMGDIHALYDFSVRHKVHILTYVDGSIVAETDSQYIDMETHITGMPHRKVDSFKKAVNSSAIKCLLLEEPSYLKEVEGILKKAMPHKSVTTSKPFFLEVMQMGIDKAASLARLSGKLQIDASEIIAVGNASNDLTMVEYAGLGVWVDNVSPELRHRANVVVASNNDDGVAEVVERFILNV
ncbi:MAG TPA: Cof-type HAD-IIB family hydrolase [Cytophagales bacterium]|nr:Cof-type HAD-IIB family hydrolase [Cytophagales bacterium]